MMAWVGPYLVDWVYTNKTVKLKDMKRLIFLGFYNISKIKKYECAVRQFGKGGRDITE